MELIDVACGECAAQPGEPCRWQEVGRSGFHPVRYEALVFIRGVSTPGEPPSKEEFDRAVESVGLF
jgi:hypothetical protein